MSVQSAIKPVDIDYAFRALQFSTPEAAGCVHAAYMAHLRQRLSQFYTRAGNMHAATAPAITGDDFFTPEVAEKLLFGVPEQQESVTRFFTEAATACWLKEESNRSTAADFSSTWTTNGDFYLSYDAQTKEFAAYNAYALLEKIPVDFFSPYWHRITEVLERADTEQYSFEEAEEVCNKLEQVLESIDQHIPVITAFIAQFTNVIVCKKNHKDPARISFVSSSSDYLIGRMLLINPLHASPEDLADAMVHEATHALLSMIDMVTQWQPSLEKAAQKGNIITSPWTGRALSVRNILQAAFVWFGLYHFWKMAHAHHVFDKAYAERRISLIREGFANLDITGINDRENLELRPLLLEVLDNMKKNVLAA